MRERIKLVKYKDEPLAQTFSRYPKWLQEIASVTNDADGVWIFDGFARRLVSWGCYVSLGPKKQIIVERGEEDLPQPPKENEE